MSIKNQYNALPILEVITIGDCDNGEFVNKIELCQNLRLHILMEVDSVHMNPYSDCTSLGRVQALYGVLKLLGDDWRHETNLSAKEAE